MATITWIDDDTGDGHGASSGLTIYMGGNPLPSNAILTKVKCYQAISSNSYSSSKKIRLYYLKRSDGTTIFSGSPAATSPMGDESGSPSAARKFHSNCTAVYTMKNSDAQSGYNYLLGSSGAKFKVKIDNSLGSNSYWRAGKLEFEYYIRCSDPTNISATGGFKQLSATWTLGSSGSGDTISHQICYSTTQTWNDSTAEYTTSTSKSWTINTAGTYYVGIRAIGSSSGVHSPIWSNAAVVSTFSPTLVKQGDLIKATDYNQIRNIYSDLTAMTAESSFVDDANITAVRNKNSNVSAATANTVVTADFFNNNVLAKIT